MMQLGDKVHYLSYGTPGGEYQSQCRLAFVTDCLASREMVTTYSVIVLNPFGTFANIYEGLEPGQIHHESHCPNR